MENAWDLFRTVQMQRIGMLNFQREVVMTILQSFKRNKPAKSRTFPRNVASNVKLDTKNHIFVKILIVTVNTVVVDQSIYSRNAMLPYIPTVSKTIIHETQNFLYCFLPEVLIMYTQPPISEKLRHFINVSLAYFWSSVIPENLKVF